MRLQGQQAAGTGKLCAKIGQYRVVGSLLFTERLPGITGHCTRFRIADVAEDAAVIAGGIFAPAGQGQVFPATDTAARLRDHQMVMGIGKQLNFRRRAVDVGEFTQFHVHFLQHIVVRFEVTTRAVKLDGIRHAFL
ncbi:hypothetical protein SRABI106_04779 [Rahnella aquatilis]|nr:hypothetical protein SRABI106_04779 [Rahnella aquatilis]